MVTASFGDHTSNSGLMMVVNGAFYQQSLWSQTISVTPGTDYNLSTWVSTWYDTSPAQLQFSINGSTIGTFSAPLTAGVWSEFATAWSSGANTSATIQIIDLNTAIGGNDFAIDDIKMAVAPEPINPDLIITRISNIPNHKKRGGKFTMKDIVKNQGTADAGQFMNGYYLSIDNVKSDDDIAIEGNRNILLLGIGTSSSKNNGAKPVKVKIPTNTSLGKYYVIVCADSENLIAESDETNNCKASKKKIRIHK